MFTVLHCMTAGDNMHDAEREEQVHSRDFDRRSPRSSNFYLGRSDPTCASKSSAVLSKPPGRSESRGLRDVGW